MRFDERYYSMPELKRMSTQERDQLMREINDRRRNDRALSTDKDTLSNIWQVAKDNKYKNLNSFEIGRQKVQNHLVEQYPEFFKNTLSNEKIPPQFIYDKVREMRKEGKSNEEISKKLHIRLSIIERII